MNKTSVFVFAGLCVAGLLSGMGARRLFTNPVESAVTEKTVGTPTVASRPSPVSFPRTKSTDESLAALDGDGLYGRLAHWLIDAGEPEIAAYWAACRQREIRPEIADLIFIQWTRLNPQGALATGELRAWWAWACHDPQAALTAALAAGPAQVENVARGLGEFHPAWLRQHFSELPEEAREAAFSGLGRWGDSENPLEMLNFAKEHRMGFDASTFKALVSKDPWAALDWAKENRRGLEVLASQLAEERPDELARLAAQSPSGAIKRKMEAALFANLIKTDPEAAIAQAEAADVPRIAAERFAAVGLALVNTDPAKAFELAKDLFTACPDAMMKRYVFQLPDSGGGGWSSGVPGVREFLSALLVEDPARIMDTITATSDREYVFDELSDQWLERDVAAYTEWVKRQTDPSIHDDAANELIGRLQRDHQYREAVEWMMTLTVRTGSHDLGQMFYQWRQINPAEPLEWLEAATLPEKEKQNLRNLLSQ